MKKDIFTATCGALVGILLLDAIAFMLWILSGQTPFDGFYFGTITAHLIKALSTLL